MTRHPVDTWLVIPRLDIPPYSLNTVCPVTGETFGLEDHHIFRRSFSALGAEKNDALYWVEVQDGDKTILKNRIALSPSAHERLTTNRARLEYRDGGLFYIEGEEEKRLDLTMHLMAEGEKVSKPRRKKAPENPKERTRLLIHVPADEVNVLPELIDAAREKLAPELGWSEDVPAYFVVVAALAAVLQD